MNYESVKTKSLDEKHYVELIKVNGKEFTQILYKVAEPNYFDIKVRLPGDHFEEMSDADYAP